MMRTALTFFLCPSPPLPCLFSQTAPFPSSHFLRPFTQNTHPPIPIHRHSGIFRHRSTHRMTSVSQIKASTPSNAGSGTDDGVMRRAPLYLLLPLLKTAGAADPVSSSEGYDLMMQWFISFANAEVQGIIMEVWWAVVEKKPRVYNWKLYLVMAEMARRCRLKVRAMLAFHECGIPPGPFSDGYDWFVLPPWVRKEITEFPELAYCDRFGGQYSKYVSLGCDDVPLQNGRTPIQVYADFMKAFKDTFKSYLGEVITGIQIGMGPDGELKYPAFNPNKEHPIELQVGEFLCYDKFMFARGCEGVNLQLMGTPDETFFIGAGVKSWNSQYGRTFLEWYSGELLMHGKRICKEAHDIFLGTNLSLSAKIPAVYWYYRTDSHPSELTAGYYNTSAREGYLPVAQMLGTYGFSMCCSSFDLQDNKQRSKYSSPEGFLRGLITAARTSNIPFEAEVVDTCLDDDFIKQVVKMSKVYCKGLERPNFSFNVRLDLDMFDDWAECYSRFRRFVREMRDGDVF